MESLLTTICDTTSIAEFKMEVRNQRFWYFIKIQITVLAPRQMVSCNAYAFQTEKLYFILCFYYGIILTSLQVFNCMSREVWLRKVCHHWFRVSFQFSLALQTRLSSQMDLLVQLPLLSPKQTRRAVASRELLIPLLMKDW